MSSAPNGTPAAALPVTGGTYRNQACRFSVAGPADHAEVLAFLHLLFPHTHYDGAWLEHQGPRSPAGPRTYYLARSETSGQVVALYGLHPVPVRLAGRTGMAAECCNIGVHPLLWGTDLFGDLSRYALRHDAAQGHWFAFCSPRRQLAVRSHLKLGWRELTRLRFFTRRPPVGPVSMPDRVAEVSTFGTETRSIAELLGGRADWLIDKNAAHLNWRYSAPCYRKFVRSDRADSHGILVTKNYVDGATGVRRLHVMELVASSPEAEQALWVAVEAASAGVDELHTWAEPGSERAAALHQRGYLPGESECPLLIYAHLPAVAAAADATRRRYVALGDDEAF